MTAGGPCGKRPGQDVCGEVRGLLPHRAAPSSRSAAAIAGAGLWLWSRAQSRHTSGDRHVGPSSFANLIPARQAQRDVFDLPPGSLTGGVLTGQFLSRLRDGHDHTVRWEAQNKSMCGVPVWWGKLTRDLRDNTGNNAYWGAWLRRGSVQFGLLGLFFCLSIMP